MSVSAGIPFLDVVTPHVELEAKLTGVFQQIMNSAIFIGGPEVESFEREFAAFCSTRFCVGVGSGTDALRFALTAAGVGAGESVLTVPNTFIATTEAISQVGAVPEFIDVDERSYNLDTAKLRQYLETQCDLDSQTGREIMELFHELHRAGSTLVLITHDPGIAEQAPRRVALRDGRVESDSGRLPPVERIPVPA